MALSKRSQRGIYVFNKINSSVKRIKYLMPTTTAHEEAIKMNARFDKERLQQENRLCQMKKLLSNQNESK